MGPGLVGRRGWPPDPHPAGRRALPRRGGRPRPAPDRPALPHARAPRGGGGVAAGLAGRGGLVANHPRPVQSAGQEGRRRESSAVGEERGPREAELLRPNFGRATEVRETRIYHPRPREAGGAPPTAARPGGLPRRVLPP